jgi:hypothetical protein
MRSGFQKKDAPVRLMRASSSTSLPLTGTSNPNVMA